MVDAAEEHPLLCPVDDQHRCAQVLLRLVQGPGRAWLDLRGLTWRQVPVPDQT